MCDGCVVWGMGLSKTSHKNHPGGGVVCVFFFCFLVLEAKEMDNDVNTPNTRVSWCLVVVAFQR